MANSEYNSNEVQRYVDYFFRTLEIHVRRDLNDSEAKVTQNGPDGRVLLDIREVSLTNLLDRLNEPNQNWRLEKAHMQMQIWSLAAQLNETHCKQDYYLKLQTAEIQDLHDKLECMKGEKKELQDSTEALKSELNTSAALHADQVNSMADQATKIRNALTDADNLMATEHVRWQQEKTSLLEEMDKCRASFENDRHHWEQEKTCLLEKMESCLSKLDGEKCEKIKLMASLMKAEQQLKTGHLTDDLHQTPENLSEEPMLDKKKKKKKWYRRSFSSISSFFKAT